MTANEIEIWKPIKEYEGLYEVSNYGRVRSLDHDQIQMSQYGKYIKKHFIGQIVKPHNNGYGYQYVSLNNMKRKNHYIHRLVADAFLDNPDGLKEVNHIDYDKMNNHVSNLEWISRKENVRWSVHHMEHPSENARLTALGRRYISKRYGKYRVNIRIKRLGYQFDKTFETLEEAIAAKEQFINGKEYFARYKRMLPVQEAICT